MADETYAEAQCSQIIWKNEHLALYRECIANGTAKYGEAVEFTTPLDTIQNLATEYKYAGILIPATILADIDAAPAAGVRCLVVHGQGVGIVGNISDAQHIYPDQIVTYNVTNKAWDSTVESGLTIAAGSVTVTSTAATATVDGIPFGTPSRAKLMVDHNTGSTDNTKANLELLW